jgi:FG-GAP-like repeat
MPARLGSAAGDAVPQHHDGTFTDVTGKAGVANERWGFGVVVGDFDNDGWPLEGE